MDFIVNKICLVLNAPAIAFLSSTKIQILFYYEEQHTNDVFLHADQNLTL